MKPRMSFPIPVAAARSAIASVVHLRPTLDTPTVGEAERVAPAAFLRREFDWRRRDDVLRGRRTAATAITRHATADVSAGRAFGANCGARDASVRLLLFAANVKRMPRLGRFTDRRRGEGFSLSLFLFARSEGSRDSVGRTPPSRSQCRVYIVTCLVAAEFLSLTLDRPAIELTRTLSLHRESNGAYRIEAA